MKKQMKKALSALAVVTALSMTVSSLSMAFNEDGSKYYADYPSMQEAQAAAADLGKELGEEGTVLLKNNGALPLDGNEWVSVLGVSSDKVEGGSTTVAASLEAAGFHVNPELKSYYEGVGTSYGKENVDGFTGNVKSSMKIYNDVAVVIFSRTGGESNDLATVMDELEDNLYGSEEMGWKHNALATDTEGNEHKHYLQLTDSEEELLEFAKANCKTVIVLINSSNVMELGNLEADDEIDAILCVYRPGADGLTALGEILNGSVNPSGKTVDIYPADLTADPTWFGYGDGSQFTLSGEYPETFFRIADGDGSEIYVRDNPNMQAQIPGVSTGYSLAEYSEDIYMGYRFYETAFAEAESGNYDGFDYDAAVVYPFGYGLSYTTFEWENVTPEAEVENWSEKASLKLQVKVTNTGAVAGKDVVEVYAHAPYTKGGVPKAEVALVGFGKTSLLKPGESEILTITVNVQDMASFDSYDKNGNGFKTYELDAGDGYELRFQSDSHNVKAVQELAALAEDVILDTDDFSGAAVSELFSNEDEYNLLGWDPAVRMTLVDEGKMVLLNRDDFAGTFPSPRTEADLVRSDEWFAFHEALDQYNADTQTIYPEDETGATEVMPWVQMAADWADGGKYAGWTQAACHAEDYSDVTIKIQKMTGIDMNDAETVLTEEDTDVAEFVGKTGVEAWEIFMNQLTWDELVKVTSNAGWGTPAVDSINKPATSDNDGPNNLSQTYSWGDECHIAATWNTDLAYRQGALMGNLAMLKGTTWYGPAMNTHRSPFGGRCNEYYSQDGYHGGMIGAAVINGCQSKGVICYVKHCAMNDQEIYRMNLLTLASEQAAREIYMKQFQLAVQEGGVAAIMTTYGSVGEYSGATNYNFMTALVRDEWGFAGYVVTDAWMPCKDYWPLDMLVRAGTNAPLENAGARSEKNESYLLSGIWDAEENCVKIKDGTTVSYTQWYSVRNMAQQELYTQCNMNVMKNGYDLTTFTGKSVTAGQAEEFRDDFGGVLDSDKVSYSVNGTLPAGLTLDAKTGTISGTPTVAGEYDFSLTMKADNWVSASTNNHLSISSAFSVDTDLTDLKVGKTVDGYIESDVVRAEDYDSLTYSVVKGALPKGVVLDGDHLTGIAEEAGTFNVSLKVEAVKVTITENSSGQSRSETKKEYMYDITLVVAE
ncbi:MAG: glycoside hydrolase family 3 C-terminal domain-containing protein [Lachnospiraceae bacterium]|nr:glycoside hydrolase family 3 C-terminal domain-containing protein [Lachnospiraceae bacterium]